VSRTEPRPAASRRRVAPALAAVALSCGLLGASAPTSQALPSPLAGAADFSLVPVVGQPSARTALRLAEYAHEAARMGKTVRIEPAESRGPAHRSRSASAATRTTQQPARASSRSEIAPTPRHTASTSTPRQTTTPRPTPSKTPRPTQTPTPTPTRTTAPAPSRDGLIASVARRYGITVHPYDHPSAPGRWGTTDLSSCQVWVGRSTPINRIEDVIKHEYGHVLQCRKHTWEGVSTIELERIADAVALRLGAHWVHYTYSPTASERAAAARLLG
jgi:hypothetical protein